MIYPEPEKLKRKGGSFLGKDQDITTGLLAKARAVLNTEFVTPINQSPTRLGSGLGSIGDRISRALPSSRK